MEQRNRHAHDAVPAKRGVSQLTRAGDRAASFSARMRTRRFARFREAVAGLPRPLRILDVGGTNAFWEACGWAGLPEVRITLVNTEPEKQRHENIVSCCGDARDLHQFATLGFEICFSNSVIEHLFTRDAQRIMAEQVRRVAPRYWVQTPNFWFPIEPHFEFVGWQWLPEGLRVAMLRRRGFGWRERAPDLETARRSVREIRLLTRTELEELFPDGTLEAERYLGLVKSWIVSRGLTP